MVYCSNCGAVLVPPYRFCEKCGHPPPAPMGTPPYYVHPPPPRSDHTALLIVLVVVLVIVLPVVVAAALYMMVSGLITGPGSPTPIALAVARSANGTYWVLTFTSAPSGMSASAGYLTMTTNPSILALPPTPLSSLTGTVTLADSLGTLYVAYRGSIADVVITGDTILIGTSTSTGASTTGYNIQVAWNGQFFNTSL